MLALIVGCGAPTSWTESPSDTTCAEWLERLTPAERARMATSVLSDLWRRDGAGASAGPDAGSLFADAIGSVCQATPADTVSMVGAAVYADLDEVAAPGGSRPATPAEEGEPHVYADDAELMLTADGVVRANVAIAEVQATDAYYGGNGDDVAGTDNVFVQLHLSYTSLVEGFDYAPTDWEVVVDGVPIDAAASLRNGPEPALDAGTLDAGSEASGYLVFEVPLEGEVVLAYTGPADGDGPPSVTLRDAPREF